MYSLCDEAASGALYDADEQHGPKQHREAGANTLQPDHMVVRLDSSSPHNHMALLRGQKLFRISSQVLL